MVGAIGQDSFGADFISALQKEGIDTSHIETIEGEKTGTANIIVEEGSGENRILFYPGANYALGIEEEGEKGEEMVVRDLVPEEADVVVFQMEIPLELVVHSIRLARERGKYVGLFSSPVNPIFLFFFVHPISLSIHAQHYPVLIRSANR